jgi:hypothetical protein
MSAHLEWSPAQIAEYAQTHREDDACRALWRRVLRVASEDLSLHRTWQGRPLWPHERRIATDLTSFPPEEFFDGPWFRAICSYLQVDADRLRAMVYERARAA